MDLFVNKEEKLKQLETVVNEIINNNYNDYLLIEKTLESIFALSDFSITNPDFFRLFNYYYYLNKEDAKYFLTSLKDVYCIEDEEEMSR